ncbi:MAG: ribonuclease III [Acidimicrobiales bacterium]
MGASPAPIPLEDLLGHEFANPDLLTLALTHRSWCAEHVGQVSNERLEFLGDAVLGLVVTSHLFERYPDLPEGQLAKTRASVVSAAALAEIGATLGVGPCLRLGKGEDASGGRTKASILADAVEAIIGAVYLDGGLTPARSLILARMGEQIELAADTPGETDHTTRLQELAAREGHNHPRYRIDESGPDHAKRFHATVVVGPVTGTGEGSSKKEAEQQAAGMAWAALDRGEVS